jgi:hypothetical protein
MMATETFEDAFGGDFLKEEGTFQFEIVETEMKQSSTGNDMIEVLLKCDEGQTKDYFVLTEKAKWKYKGFIALAFGFTSKEALIAAGFSKDLTTVHNELIGKKVWAEVKEEKYTKDVKVANDDDTFTTKKEERTSYKITKYLAM